MNRMEAQRRNLAEARKLFRRALQVGALGRAVNSSRDMACC